MIYGGGFESHPRYCLYCSQLNFPILSAAACFWANNYSLQQGILSKLTRHFRSKPLILNNFNAIIMVLEFSD